MKHDICYYKPWLICGKRIVVNSTWFESVTARLTAMNTEIRSPVQCQVFDSTDHYEHYCGVCRMETEPSKTNSTELPIWTANYRRHALPVPNITTICDAKIKDEIWKKPRQLTVQSVFVQRGLPVIIFNKKQHHEWCGDLQKETTTQSGNQKTVEPANGSFYRRDDIKNKAESWVATRLRDEYLTGPNLSWIAVYNFANSKRMQLK